MAPKYKVHYFNTTALGEPIRYLLAYGNLDWQDVRYDEATWAQTKTKMPFGQVPVLEIDGKPYAQSSSISRYVAKQVGLSGKDDLESLEIDIAIDLFHDFRLKVVGWFYDPFPESKASKEGPLFKEQMPFYLNKFESMAKENGGHLVGGRLTLADVYFCAPLKYYKNLVGRDFLEDYPVLKALEKQVESQPNIAAYIAKRPASER